MYECKPTATTSNAHIQQCRRAKQYRGADCAVLVTTGKKEGFTGLAQANGVLMVSPLGAIPLASLLRGYLAGMMRAKIAKEKRSVIAQQLMKHIASPQFKNPIEEVIQLTYASGQMIRDEARQHFKTWQKRWDHYQTGNWDSRLISDNIQLVLQGKEPKPIGHPKAQRLQLPIPTDWLPPKSGKHRAHPVPRQLLSQSGAIQRSAGNLLLWRSRASIFVRIVQLQQDNDHA